MCLIAIFSIQNRKKIQDLFVQKEKGQRKNNDLQKNTYKIKDWATRTLLQPGVNSGRVSNTNPTTTWGELRKGKQHEIYYNLGWTQEG